MKVITAVGWIVTLSSLWCWEVCCGFRERSEFFVELYPVSSPSPDNTQMPTMVSRRVDRRRPLNYRGGMHIDDNHDQRYDDSKTKKPAATTNSLDIYSLQNQQQAFVTVTRSSPGSLDNYETSSSIKSKQPAAAAVVHNFPCFGTTDELYKAVDEFADKKQASQAVAFYGPFEYWCVSKLTDFRAVFSAKRNTTVWRDFDFQEHDVSQWDVSNATTMSAMFRGSSINVANLRSWDVSHVQDMSSMFRDAQNFQGIGLEDWNVTSLEKAPMMFKGATTFNRDLSTWDVRHVTNMCYMFANTQSFDQNLCVWGDLLPIASTSGTFSKATSCPTQRDPLLTPSTSSSVAGPFCHECLLAAATTTTTTTTTNHFPHNTDSYTNTAQQKIPPQYRSHRRPSSHESAASSSTLF